MRGFEIATCYSVLAVVERERLESQAKLDATGDVEAKPIDEDFVRSLEYGMPPCSGIGMGIDRPLMAITDLGIGETILFPLVRPEWHSRPSSNSSTTWTVQVSERPSCSRSFALNE